MRFLPNIDDTCRVCGTGYTLVRVYQKNRCTLRPRACPACKAPYKAGPNRQLAIGDAKGLLWALSKSDYFRRVHKTAADQLLARCRDESDVEHLVSVAAHMDYDAWVRDEKECIEPGPKTTPAERQLDFLHRESLKWIPTLRKDARTGLLLPKLYAARSIACRALREEREMHLAIYESRRRR